MQHSFYTRSTVDQLSGIKLRSGADDFVRLMRINHKEIKKWQSRSDTAIICTAAITTLSSGWTDRIF